jgi:putative transposase
MGDELKITRRHLPHWTIDGAIYFVTFRSNVILQPEERTIVLNHLLDGNEKFYTLIASVIMPDHAHILIFPKKGYPLDRIMRGIKGVSAKKINQYRKTSGQIWQHESYDHIVRDGNELRQKFDYIANNPVKDELVENTSSYVGWYCNDRIII